MGVVLKRLVSISQVTPGSVDSPVVPPNTTWQVSVMTIAIRVDGVVDLGWTVNHVPNGGGGPGNTLRVQIRAGAGIYQYNEDFGHGAVMLAGDKMNLSWGISGGAAGNVTFALNVYGAEITP